MDNLILIGSGGLGKELYNYLQLDSNINFNIIGILDDSKENYINSNIPLEYLGKISDYEFGSNDRCIVSIGNPTIRKKVYNLIGPKCKFFTYIHPSAYVASDAVVKSGCIIGPFCTVNSNSIVEENSILNTYSSIGHDSVVGKHSVLAPYSTILGFGKIGEECFLATRATILPDVKIGNNITVSAHTSVRKNCEDNLILFERPKMFKSNK